MIAYQYWTEIPIHFPFVELDEFIIMPDHLHGILLFNKIEQSAWQPRYYDRIIRNSNELERIRKYISDNPGNWLSEKGNPENLYR
jgi:REP element-mobilizing transposase RayT